MQVVHQWKQLVLIGTPIGTVCLPFHRKNRILESSFASRTINVLIYLQLFLFNDLASQA